MKKCLTGILPLLFLSNLESPKAFSVANTSSAVILDHSRSLLVHRLNDLLMLAGTVMMPFGFSPWAKMMLEQRVLQFELRGTQIVGKKITV